eukprot:scaffold17799_cov43-Prasinocladus_malaysianus.AAC.5
MHMVERLECADGDRGCPVVLHWAVVPRCGRANRPRIGVHEDAVHHEPQLTRASTHAGGLVGHRQKAPASRADLGSVVGRLEVLPAGLSAVCAAGALTLRLVNVKEHPGALQAQTPLAIGCGQDDLLPWGIIRVYPCIDMKVAYIQLALDGNLSIALGEVQGVVLVGVVPGQKLAVL